MSIVSGDMLAMAMGGVLESRSISSLPSTPTLTLASVAGQVTATIDGDAGVTNYLKYKASSDSGWQDGGSRSGDGDLVVSGLANDTPYIFIAYSIDEDDVASLPSIAQTVTFAETTDNDLDRLLVDTTAEFLDRFGEDIKYLPAGGGQREIVGIISRQPSTDLESPPHGITPLITVSVANNSTTGISSSEVNTGGDKIELDLRKGDAVQQRRIIKILSQDAGMMKLEVR